MKFSHYSKYAKYLFYLNTMIVVLMILQVFEPRSEQIFYCCFVYIPLGLFLFFLILSFKLGKVGLGAFVIMLVNVGIVLYALYVLDSILRVN